MLVREQDDDLHLLSAVSPAWLRPGESIELRGAPTAFGPVDMTVTAGDDRVTIDLPSEFRNAPAKLWVRVPWFYALEAAEVDGRPVTAEDGRLLIPQGTARLVLRGAIAPSTPGLSYDNAVADYKAEYRARWEHFRRTGERLP